MEKGIPKVAHYPLKNENKSIHLYGTNINAIKTTKHEMLKGMNLRFKRMNQKFKILNLRFRWEKHGDKMRNHMIGSVSVLLWLCETMTPNI